MGHQLPRRPSPQRGSFAPESGLDGHDCSSPVAVGDCSCINQSATPDEDLKKKCAEGRYETQKE
jgi:hypothetical protein